MTKAANKRVAVYSVIEDNDVLALNLPQSQKDIATAIGFTKGEVPAGKTVIAKTQAQGLGQGLLFPLSLKYVRKTGSGDKTQTARILVRADKLEEVIKSGLRGKKYNGHSIVGAGPRLQRLVSY